MKSKRLAVLAALLIGVLTLSACGLVTAQGTPVDPQGVENMRTLAVTGTGKVVLVPDLAYINIGVHSEGEDVSTALADNNEMAMAITDAIKRQDVDAADIQTSNFNVYSIAQYDNMGQQTSTRYAVDNTLYVTVRDLTKLSAVLDASLGAGANQIYGVNFDIADRSGALDQARGLAIQDAQAKAVAVAATAGVNLGEVQTINVSTNSYVQPYSYAGMGGGGAAIDSSVPISAGQIVITFDANLTYRIN